MKKITPFLLFPVLLAMAIGLSRCSVSPVADGGTHTGNPDITACASTLFELTENSLAWHVNDYLDTQRLNPSAIVPPSGTDDITAPYKNVLAKQLLTVTQNQDTVLIYDTLFANDTMINRYVKADTTDTIVGVDTLVYVNKVLIADTLIATDTVILVDTLVFDGIGISAPALNPDGKYSVYADSRTIPVLGMESLYATTFTVRPPSITDAVSRSGSFTTHSGTKVVIEYSDADGDNLLFGSSVGAGPTVFLRESLINGTSGRYLLASFDGGADGELRTVSDNKILSLIRQRVEHNDTVETIGFSRSWVDKSGELAIEQFHPSDSVFSRNIQCIVAAGDDRLTRLVHTTVYRRGDIDRLQVTVTPTMPITAGEALSQATFSAAVIAVDGDSTSLVGTLDARTGITALYYSDGKTYDVTVDAKNAVSIRQR